MRRRSFHATPEDARAGLEAAVARALGVAPHDAAAYVAGGAVYVRGRRVSPRGAKLQAGDPVQVVLEEAGRSGLEPARLPGLDVLFEDATCTAVNKPAGVVTQPTPGGRGSSLLDAAVARWGESVGLVHRLDRDTSGVVLFGRTASATRSLAAAFRERRVEKQYLAVVGPSAPSDGTIDLPISKDPGRPGRYRATRAAHGAPALTRFRLARGTSDFSVLELVPETGRTHQLRAHLAALGWPILGDALYGGPVACAGAPVARCLLHAFRLLVPHPRSGAPLRLEAPSPADFAPFLAKL